GGPGWFVVAAFMRPASRPAEAPEVGEKVVRERRTPAPRSAPLKRGTTSGTVFGPHLTLPRCPQRGRFPPPLNRFGRRPNRGKGIGPGRVSALGLRAHPPVRTRRRSVDPHDRPRFPGTVRDPPAARRGRDGSGVAGPPAR